jgi:hypothetical protein
LFDHETGNRQRNGAVRSRSHRQPLVCFHGKTDVTRIDDDKLCSALPRVGNGSRGREPRCARIKTPQEETPSTFKVRQSNAGARDERGTELPVPRA